MSGDDEMYEPVCCADALKFVQEFRRAIALRDAATTDIDRAEYDRIALRTRQAWQAVNGDDDDLLELAFGEPWPDE